MGEMYKKYKNMYIARWRRYRNNLKKINKIYEITRAL
jgi:hypothetical protein